jgi:cytochrome P450
MMQPDLLRLCLPMTWTMRPLTLARSTVDFMTSPSITGHADVCAVLADPRYQVPPAPAVPDGEHGTLAWLRSSVSRFSEGPAHARRRALAERDLAGMDPGRLRQRAAAATAEQLALLGTGPFDLMPLARRIPVSVLVTELPMTGAADLASVAEAVVTASPGYLNPDQAGQEADAAVAVLASALRATEAEVTANRIALLMQACEATAGLIGNAVARALGATELGTPDELLSQTLDQDPPVLRTRRLDPDGDVVAVDITTVPFGAGRRPCPGSDQATALAAGVLDAVIPACELAEADVPYPEAGNLRVPVRLLLTRR